MADLVFATKGQAELLAAQESLRKKALETKQEFEEAAKATGAWDAATMKLKSSAESALRSVNTEQEKILDRINKIQEAQEKGLIADKEAEEAVKRLRQQWVDVDEATLKAAEATEKARQETEEQERAHLKLKSSAESALRSIQTEEQRILEQIEEIESAMAQGLVPPDEAEAGLERLRDKLGDIREDSEETAKSGGKLAMAFSKAFDPTQIGGMIAGFVGVKSIISGIREEFEDLQVAIDSRASAAEREMRKGDTLGATVEATKQARKQAEEEHRKAWEEFEKAKAAQRAALAGGSETDQQRAHARTQDAKQRAFTSTNTLNAAGDNVQAAEAARRQWEQTPEGQAALIAAERRDALFKLRDKVVLNSPVSMKSFSTEEIKAIEDIERATGQGVYSRKFNRLMQSALDGETSTDEVATGAENEARRLRNPYVPFSGDENTGREAASRPATAEEIKAASALEEMVQLFRENNQKIDRQTEAMERAAREGGLIGENL